MQVIGPFRLNPTQAAQQPSRMTQAGGAGGPSKPSASPVDQLDISPQARAAGDVAAPSAASSAAPSTAPATVGGDMRLDKIADIRRQIASGSYDTPEKMDIALGRMFDEMG